MMFGPRRARTPVGVVMCSLVSAQDGSGRPQSAAAVSWLNTADAGSARAIAAQVCSSVVAVAGIRIPRIGARRSRARRRPAGTAASAVRNDRPRSGSGSGAGGRGIRPSWRARGALSASSTGFPVFPPISAIVQERTPPAPARHPPSPASAPPPGTCRETSESDATYRHLTAAARGISRHGADRADPGDADSRHPHLPTTPEHLPRNAGIGCPLPTLRSKCPSAGKARSSNPDGATASFFGHLPPDAENKPPIPTLRGKCRSGSGRGGTGSGAGTGAIAARSGNRMPDTDISRHVPALPVATGSTCREMRLCGIRYQPLAASVRGRTSTDAGVRT